MTLSIFSIENELGEASGGVLRVLVMGDADAVSMREAHAAGLIESYWHASVALTPKGQAWLARLNEMSEELMRAQAHAISGIIGAPRRQMPAWAGRGWQGRTFIPSQLGFAVAVLKAQRDKDFGETIIGKALRLSAGSCMRWRGRQ